jgi:hypothetical protein
VKPWPVDDIDPIEELARIINEAQERDVQDERRFDELARIAGSEPKRARRAGPPANSPHATVLKVAGARDPIATIPELCRRLRPEAGRTTDRAFARRLVTATDRGPPRAEAVRSVRTE